MNNVFVCKIAKKNHDFGTFSSKIVLLHTKNELSGVKEVNGVKGVKDKCFAIVGISIHVKPRDGELPVSDEAFVLNSFDSINSFNSKH